MKNKFILSIVFISIYFLTVVLLFFITKEVIDTIYGYFSVVAGIIAALYFVPFSLIKSIRQELAVRKYLIASDIIFYFIFVHMVLIVLADNPLFKIFGLVITLANIIFWFVTYFKVKDKNEVIKKLLILHATMMFLIPLLRR